MEEGHQSRFVCRLCNKRFPSGKSYGGHMRSHVVSNSAESEEKFEAKNVKKNQFSASEHEDQVKDSWEFAEFGEGQSGGYGLRENPKKTWRATGSASPSLRTCKQCGKGFQSLKALCGHMACHSDKERVLGDDSSWTSENHKMVMDGFSDTESDQRKLRSSRRSSSVSKKRVKSVEDSPFSSVYEIVGQEQEDVARCLMLLSRDQMNKGCGGYSVVESSDNNSVVLETKSSSIDMKTGKGKKLFDEFSKMKMAAMEDSDSGYFLDEGGETESNDNYGDEFKEKSLKRFIHEDGIESRNVKKYGSESFNCSAKTEATASENSPKRSKYECFNCKKVFKSYQALGGHRPCNRKCNANAETRYESGENSLEDDDQSYRYVEPPSHNKKPSSKTSKTSLKKNKVHVCPFCDRVFKNGQALGGHKRSHFINAHDQTSNRSTTPLIKRDLHDQLDLNLPAPEAASEDAPSAHGRFF